ncbi:hypothetical protein CGEO_1201 [Campylobacter geochelonis]|nr:hypothetical protein CGEO_1201 [Campylobacter geochelonis]
MDTIIGNKGDDVLSGGNGDDVYLFNKGDGKDIVSDNSIFSNHDIIKFIDVNKDEISLYKDKDNLIIKYGENDSITIKGNFSNLANKIEFFEFKDKAISYNRLMQTTPIEENLTIFGTSNDDTLISKANNSTLQGENGNDTYIITKEATNTTIKDKELINLIEGGDDTLILQGVKKEEISFKLDGVFMQDLVIRYGSDNNTTLTIKNQTNKYSQIETIKLDDNSFISNEQIDKIIQQVNAYTSDNGISNITHDEARNNQAIMQIYASGWGS